MSYRSRTRKYFRLVKLIGNIKINNKSVNETLINGYPIWEIYSPESTWRHFFDYDNFRWRLRYKKILKSYFLILIFFLKILREIFSKKKKHINHTNKEYILFCCFDRRMYIEILQNVIKKLDSSKKNILIINDFNQKSSDKKNEGNVINVDINEIPLQISYFFRFLSGIVNFPINHHKFKSSKILKRMIFFVFRSLPLKDILFYNASDFVFSNFRFTKVFTADISDARTRIILSRAKQLKIDRYVYQFGLIDDLSYEYSFHMDCKFIPWGKIFTTIMKNHGIKEKNIINSSFQRFTKITRKRESKSTLQIFILSTYFDDAHEEFCSPEILMSMKIDSIQECLSISKNIFFKPHPSEKISLKLRQYLDDRVIVLGNNVDIFSIAKENDIFISFGSSMCFAAIKNRLKIITISYNGWPFLSPILMNDSFNVVKNRIQLRNYLRLFSSNSNIKAIKFRNYFL